MFVIGLYFMCAYALSRVFVCVSTRVCIMVVCFQMLLYVFSLCVCASYYCVCVFTLCLFERLKHVLYVVHVFLYVH